MPTSNERKMLSSNEALKELMSPEIKHIDATGYLRCSNESEQAFPCRKYQLNWTICAPKYEQ